MTASIDEKLMAAARDLMPVKYRPVRLVVENMYATLVRLRTDGFSWAEITTICTNAGVTTPDGKALSVNTLRCTFYVIAKGRKSRGAKLAAPAKATTSMPKITAAESSNPAPKKGIRNFGRPMPTAEGREPIDLAALGINKGEARTIWPPGHPNAPKNEAK